MESERQQTIERRNEIYLAVGVLMLYSDIDIFNQWLKLAVKSKRIDEFVRQMRSSAGACQNRPG